MTLWLGTKDGLRTLDGPLVLQGPVRALAHDGDAVWAVVNDRELWRATAGERVHVASACSSGPYAKHSALVRRAWHDEAFTPSLTTGANVHALSAHGANVACADDDGYVWTSADAGATWQDAGARGADAVLVTA